MRFQLSGFSPRPNLQAVLFGILSILVLCVVVPWKPIMPNSSLDYSWMLAMNQAVAQKIVIGRDAIFTFGPFSAIYSEQYNPHTDTIMVLGALWIAFCYIVILYNLVNRSIGSSILLAWIFLAFMFTRDVLFNTYALLFFVLCYDVSEKASESAEKLASLAVASTAFGIIIGIKSSLIILSIAACGLGALLLLLSGKPRSAALVVVVPTLSAVVAWMVIGQPLTGLYHYLKNSATITGGYTEAMAVWGDPKDVIVYIGAAVVVMIAALAKRTWSMAATGLVSLFFLLFLFMNFKAGFVRHDSHSLTAGSAILVAAVALGFIPGRYARLAALACGLIALIAIDYGTTHSIEELAFNNPMKTLHHVRDGIGVRLDGSLPRQFDRAIADIRDESPLPTLKGASDIYPVDLAALLASDNSWRPRGVIQSYQAYGRLLVQDAAHLSSPSAPDNIFYRIEPIDGQFPLMADGLSVPEMLRLYEPRSLDAQTLVLRRRPPTAPLVGERKLIAALQAQVGQAVAVPAGKGAIFAEFHFGKSRKRTLASLAFKTPTVFLKVQLADGSSRRFRLIPEMAEKGFVVSPLVENVNDLGSLFIGAPPPEKAVVNLTVEQDSGFGGLPPGYELRFYDQPLPSGSPASLFETFSTKAPIATANVTQSCDGNIDYINGKPASEPVKGPTLDVKGWMAVNAKQGLAADSVFLTLKKGDQETWYLKTGAQPRDDVANAYKDAALRLTGYAGVGVLPSEPGDYVLGVAAMKGTMLVTCSTFAVPVHVH